MSYINNESNEEQVINEITEDELDALLDDEQDSYDDAVEEADEIPKKKIDYKKISTLIISVFLIISLGAFGFIQLDKQSKSYVMTFEGDKISINDYKLCLLFQGNSTNAKEGALSTLIDFLVIEKAARDFGIVLSESEKSEVIKNAESLKESISSAGLEMPEITNERLTGILSVNLYFEKIVQELANDFVVDEDDFKKELADYLENSRQDYVDVKLKYIVTETREKAEEARNKVLSGIPVDEVIKEYSSDYDEASGINLISLKDLSLDNDVVDSILALKTTEMTDVIDLDGAFVIFEAEEIDIPSNEEVEGSYREIYIQNKSIEIFEAELGKWRGNAVYSINQKAIDAIE